MNLIQKWLKKLSEENEKSFGTGRMDCCNLNNKKDPKLVAQSSKNNKDK